MSISVFFLQSTNILKFWTFLEVGLDHLYQIIQLRLILLDMLIPFFNHVSKLERWLQILNLQRLIIVYSQFTINLVLLSLLFQQLQLLLQALHIQNSLLRILLLLLHGQALL